MIEFNLEDNEYIQLCDLLKRVGLCESGGAAKNVISQGLVTVDGKIELRKRCKVRQDQIIIFCDETIKIIT